MPFPTPGITISSGSGESIAFQGVDATKYEALTRVAPSGRFDDSLYVVLALAIPRGANKNFLGIVNYTNSNVMVEVSRASVWAELTATATGIVPGYQVYRCTSMSITALSGEILANTAIQRFDLQDPNPPARVVVGRNNFIETGLSTEPIVAGSIGAEEAGAGGMTILSFPRGARTNASTFTRLFDEQVMGNPILLSTGQGITIRQGGQPGSVARTSARIVFRLVS